MATEINPQVTTNVQPPSPGFDIQGLIRTLLSAVGAYLLGKNILGHAVDENIWVAVTGAIMGAFSIVWSIIDKTANVEKLQGALRQTATFAASLAGTFGFMKAEDVVSIVGIIGALIPFVYAGLSRKKTQDLATGKLSTAELKK